MVAGAKILALAVCLRQGYWDRLRLAPSTRGQAWPTLETHTNGMQLQHCCAIVNAAHAHAHTALLRRSMPSALHRQGATAAPLLLGTT